MLSIKKSGRVASDCIVRQVYSHLTCASAGITNGRRIFADTFIHVAGAATAGKHTVFNSIGTCTLTLIIVVDRNRAIFELAAADSHASICIVINRRINILNRAVFDGRIHSAIIRTHVAQIKQSAFTCSSGRANILAIFNYKVLRITGTGAISSHIKILCIMDFNTKIVGAVICTRVNGNLTVFEIRAVCINSKVMLYVSSTVCAIAASNAGCRVLLAVNSGCTSICSFVVVGNIMQAVSILINGGHRFFVSAGIFKAFGRHASRISRIGSILVVVTAVVSFS